MALCTIENLSFSYPEQAEKALDGVSLTLEKGSFMVLCGASGCGKSTLLRQLKPALAPHGVRSGRILFQGEPLEETDLRTQTERIGFVQQSPENQIVTDRVWHELAFGPESLGWETPVIRRRVAEMASFFGIQTWFHRDTASLSGGQKQLLNLAAVMVMQPELLILDEPTAQLDPIAAGEFIAALGKINRELGTTIFLTEHRLEEVFPLATAAAVLDRGRLFALGTPGEVGKKLRAAGHSLFCAMPAAMQIWAAVPEGGVCPVTVREGRQWLGAYAKGHPLGAVPSPEGPKPKGEALLTMDDVWFRYEKDGGDIVRGLDLTLHRGELLALLGGNGTGKTTTLRLAAGELSPRQGTLERSGSVCLLPQDPRTLFVKKTVRDDLQDLLKTQSLGAAEKEAELGRVVRLCHLEELLERHPYDLSGGEQQRAALAKILLLRRDILLLDEPTKGLDAAFRRTLGRMLRQLTEAGVSILMVSHDIEFCARYADRCALFFDGGIVTEGPARPFFAGNRFYTTAAGRIAGEQLPGAVLCEDVIAACGGAVPEEPPLPKIDAAPLPPRPASAEEEREPLPLWRKLLAAAGGLSALAILWKILSVSSLSGLISPEGFTPEAQVQFVLYGALLACLGIFAAAVSRKSYRKDFLLQQPEERRRLTRRTKAAAGLILLLIPLTIFFGEAFLDGRKYYFISLLILFEMMVPFLLIFEGRRPRARELVVLAALCAIGVAGRAAFFMLPECKPVLALTIVAAVAFGGETGFLVGAVTMLVSNMMMGQGPWTPWQMFAMGLCGFLAGVLFRKGVLRRSRGALCVFGAFSALLIYGVLMNTSAVLTAAETLTHGAWLAGLLTGFPMDCIHAGATVLFLWFAAEPMLEKLDRIKTKYGLAE